MRRLLTPNYHSLSTITGMKITHNDKEITFTFDRFQQRYNPYMEDEDQKLLGKYPTFTGLIVRHRKNSNYEEFGFASTIDMDYKGKDDQVGEFIVMWQGEEDTFIEMCKILEIGIHEIEC